MSIMNIKRILFILVCGITALSISSCATSGYQKHYPEQLSKKVDFDMPLSDFNDLKGTSASDMKDESFRYVYVEEISDSELANIVYYFDKDGDQPLYEMIFVYKDTNTLNTAADKLLGDPNYGEEWRLEKKPYVLTAWKYKTKLVLAALIPNTEWAEKGYYD